MSREDLLIHNFLASRILNTLSFNLNFYEMSPSDIDKKLIEKLENVTDLDICVEGLYKQLTETPNLSQKLESLNTIADSQNEELLTLSEVTLFKLVKLSFLISRLFSRNMHAGLCAACKQVDDSNELANTLHNIRQSQFQFLGITFRVIENYKYWWKLKDVNSRLKFMDKVIARYNKHEQHYSL